MREKEYFTRSINVDITVATIGINKEDWYCFRPGMTCLDVLNTMIFKKYDIVPILNNAGVFESYFTLSSENDSKLIVNKIEQEDRLYYLTHVRDAIWKMNKSKKTHFFLSNGQDENDIVGLISMSDFNSREFYVYLFSMISFIEREFAAMITSDKSSAFKTLENYLQTDRLKKQFKTIIQRIKQDEKNENENDYKEYLYLSHLIWLIKGEKKYKNLDYKSSQDFETGTTILKDLRNEIAHPVRSIVRNLNDLAFLDQGIGKLYEFKERLDNYLKKPLG